MFDRIKTKLLLKFRGVAPMNNPKPGDIEAYDLVCEDGCVIHPGERMVFEDMIVVFHGRHRDTHEMVLEIISSSDSSS